MVGSCGDDIGSGVNNEWEVQKKAGGWKAQAD